MGKRKLTKQQKNRVKQKQKEKILQHQASIKDSENSQITAASANVSTSIKASSSNTPSYEGIVIASYGTKADVMLLDGTDTVYKCYFRSNLSLVVAGDYVILQPDNKAGKDAGIIVAALPRYNQLSRSDAKGNAKIFAVNIDLLFIVIAPVPEFNLRMLDRYLVIAGYFKVKPVILVNKTDLLSEDRTEIDFLKIYQSIGFECLQVSAVESNGINILENQLHEKSAILVGQSGVGKSSIINKLLPHANMKVGAVSKTKERGRHTTTTSKLFKLKCGGRLIDAPGISTLTVANLSESDLVCGFPELMPVFGHCKFSNCRHQSEPECALQNAYKEGVISSQRWDSFLQLLEIV